MVGLAWVALQVVLLSKDRVVAQVGVVVGCPVVDQVVAANLVVEVVRACRERFGSCFWEESWEYAGKV